MSAARARAPRRKEADEVGQRAARRSRAKAGARARAICEREGPARVAAVVLAAGRSTRMRGVNKLLAPLCGGPLVARAVDAALASRAEAVVVVTGFQAARVRRALAGREVEFAHNRSYARGLSSSLRRGLRSLGEATDGALICLADMPWVSAAHLDRLIAAFGRADRPICVPARGGRRGNPVLWPARHFAALCALRGDRGGRALLRRHADEVVRVAMPDAGVTRDVDTPTDYSRAISGRRASRARLA
ncbi:MAG TPA: nucleotidyltransferase family protein [Myxococcota bacterium]|nr:nucleotidyltransferase family protein [Myxococcota bacterium]